MEQIGPAICQSVCIAFVSALIGYALGITRDDRAAKRTAAAKFRATVLAALPGVYPLVSHWPDDIDVFLCRASPEIEGAVARFRPFVSPWRRRGFDQAPHRRRRPRSAGRSAISTKRLRIFARHQAGTSVKPRAACSSAHSVKPRRAF
jgi:hypothetical protein